MLLGVGVKGGLHTRMGRAEVGFSKTQGKDSAKENSNYLEERMGLYSK